MANKQTPKDKGMQGRNYDELSGVGTSSAGPTGTIGNLNDAGRDGGIGAPDYGDEGNLQSAGQGQPGGTPAQGRSWRGQAGAQQAHPQQDDLDIGQQSGNRQSGNLGGRQDQSDLASGPGDNAQRGYDVGRQGGSQQSASRQTGSQQSGSQSGRQDNLAPDQNQLDQDNPGSGGKRQR